MIKLTWVLAACIVVPLIPPPALGGAVDEGEDRSWRAVFEATCARCHPADRALGQNRTAAEWREVVLRMQGYAAGGEKAFSQETAEAIIAHLAGDAVSEQEAAAEGGFTGVGEVLGIVTGILVACMIASGLLRRRLKRRFRPLHATMAAVLVVTLLVHAGTLYLHAGPPRSLWHLCGSVALLAVLGTAGGGLLRRRLGQTFLKLHMAGAFTALVLLVLHRVLA